MPSPRIAPNGAVPVDGGGHWPATTGAGMIDPLHACAPTSRSGKHLWYHIECRPLGRRPPLGVESTAPGCLAGIERADSITIDAHKNGWPTEPIGPCALFITRHGHLFVRGISRLDELHAVRVFPAWDPYLNQRAVGRAVSWDCACFLAPLPSAGWDGPGRARGTQAPLVVERVKERLVALGVGRSPKRFPAGGARCGAAPLHFGDVCGDLVRRVVAGGRAWVAPHHVRGPRRGSGFCATKTAKTTIEGPVNALVAALNGL